MFAVHIQDNVEHGQGAVPSATYVHDAHLNEIKRTKYIY